MAQNRGQIVSEALLIVGNPTLTTRANFALNRVLQRIYMSWPWPFLRKSLSGIALGSGVTSLAFGNGQGGEALQVLRILDPLWIYTSDYTTQARPRIIEQPNAEITSEEALQNPATYIGLPQSFKINPVNGTAFQWNLIPTPFPDKNYLLKLDYLTLPADIDTSAAGDSVVPTYPSVSTLVQGILYEMALYNEAGQQDHAASNNEMMKLKEMIVEDRMRFGYSAGVNENINLDPATFKRQRTVPTSPFR